MIAQQLKIDNFKASNGWLERFKKRYNVSFGGHESQDDEEPTRKIHKLDVEEVQEQKTMIWTTSQSDDICEYLDESEIIEEDVALVKTENENCRAFEFEYIDTALSTMLIGCSVTFEAIDSPHFKNFVAALNPHYELPTSEKLKEKVISKLQGKENCENDF